MDSDVMDKCCKMVGAFFSRVTSSHSRRRDNSPQVVDVIRAVPHNGVPTKEPASGAYKAGVWVWDVPHARTSPRPHRSKHGDGDGGVDGVEVKDQRKCHTVERSPEPTKKLPQLTYPADSKSVTASTATILDNDVKHASLLRKLHPTNTLERTEKYMTLPHVHTKPRPELKHEGNTATRHPKSEVSGNPRTHPGHRRRSKEEEVRCLAQSMVCNIENLIDNLHGIVGDLRQLVQQIDAVTDSIDVHCSTGEDDARPELDVAVANTCTQTDLDQQSQASSGDADHVRKSDHVQKSVSHRYSYPQYRYNPLSSIPSPPSSHTLQIPVAASSPRQQWHKYNEMRQDQLAHVRPAGSPNAQHRPRAFSGAPFEDSRGQFLMPSMCGRSPEPSMPFVPVESPPNPAPMLFSAYREETASQGKDSDSLPDRSLKTWKEKMEQHCGSADSLTPQIDWSYLVLTDHHISATMEERKRSKLGERKQPQINRCMDPSSLPRDRSKLKLSAHNADVRRVQKERSRLSQTGMRLKHQAGAITRIPEQGEPPCDSSYDENCEVFTYIETCRNVSATRTSAKIAQAVKQRKDIRHADKQSSEPSPPNPRSVPQNANSARALPQVQQSIGTSSLGWNTRGQALPNWPSGDLSSIGASDSDLDDLSSPFHPQNFQYPRRSSALDSGSEKTAPEVDTKLTRTSSVSETIASGGFEVRADLTMSPESEAPGPYAGPYENAMETRLEQLTNECSDFSDVDADAGSDVLEQSLTSLEETSSAKYDRELNTWTSYTMTHIDSDDVVSECTSDVLNENLLEMVTNNPGFDDVSLNFDELGFLPLPLQGSTVETLSPSLE